MVGFASNKPADALAVMGSILKYMYFKYMLSILQCILNTFVVFVI